MAVNAVPAGYHTVTPMLVVDDAVEFISFVEQVFNGELTERVDGPDGKIMHGEMKIGDSMVMLGQASPQWPATTATLYLYLADCDEAYQRGIAAGAASLGEPKDQFWGERMGGFKDKFGLTWWVAKHIKDVPQEELQQLMQQYSAEKKKEGMSEQAG